MASLTEQSKVRELFDSMTLGVVRSLGKSTTNILKDSKITTALLRSVFLINVKKSRESACPPQVCVAGLCRPENL